MCRFTRKLVGSVTFGGSVTVTEPMTVTLQKMGFMASFILAVWFLKQHNEHEGFFPSIAPWFFTTFFRSGW